MQDIEIAVKLLVAAFPTFAINVEHSVWSHFRRFENKRANNETRYTVSIVKPGGTTEECRLFSGPTLAEAVGKALMAAERQ